MTEPRSIVGSHRQPRDSERVVVYVLVVATDCGREIMYVGQSKQFEKRLEAHRNSSSEMSYLDPERGKVRGGYSVERVVRSEECDDLAEAQIREKEVYVDLAAEHGAVNVAGAVAP